jgi:hypothetical protein
MPHAHLYSMAFMTYEQQRQRNWRYEKGERILEPVICLFISVDSFNRRTIHMPYAHLNQEIY